MDKRPIGVFDSGVGGLTVFSAIRKELSNENLMYLGDTANFPYGPKSKEEIVALTKKNIEMLINKNCKLIVIACGTATSQALEEVNKMYTVPIIGIIEPTVENVLKEKSRVIGVIATEGTIRSGAWELAIKTKNKDMEVISKACPLLAKMAEEDFRTEEIRKSLEEYLHPFKSTYVDKLILGCTHYPIFKDLIQEELKNTEIISTSEIVAHYIKKRPECSRETTLPFLENKGEYEIILTSESTKFKEIAKRLFNIEENKINLVNI